MSYLPELREALVKAAQSRQEPSPQSSPTRWRRVRTTGRLIPALVALGLTGAVAFVALTAFRHGPEPQPAAHPIGPIHVPGPITSISSSGPSVGNAGPPELETAAKQTIARDPACSATARHLAATSGGQPNPDLVSTLGVLRTPATADDRLPSAVIDSTPSREVYVNGVHRAQSAFGVTFFLIPVGNVAGARAVPARCEAEQRQALRRELAHAAPRRITELLSLQAQLLSEQRQLAAHPEGICLVESTPGAPVGVNIDCHALLDVRRGRVFAPINSSSGELFGGVVPDGVSTVVLRFALRQGAPVTVTATVVRNVFVARVPQGVPSTVSPQITSRSADGRVLRVIPGFGP